MDRYYTYTIKMEMAKEGGYVVTVPALPGCHTQGRTYDEAEVNAKEAIQGFLEFLEKTGRPIPVETRHPHEMRLQVRIPSMA